MFAVEEKDQGTAGIPTEQLSAEIAGDARPGKFSGLGHGESYGGIQMRSTECLRTEDTNKNRQTPTGRDDNPARVVSFGAGQEHIGDDAVSERHEDCGADKFGQVWTHSV